MRSSYAGRRPAVTILGAGELASGIALRLHRCGFPILMTEIGRPRAVRRTVAFSEAVYDGRANVEEAAAVLAADLHEADEAIGRGEIPVVVDPSGELWRRRAADVLVDGRMLKGGHGLNRDDASLVVGLGPGFRAPADCRFIVETARGHGLGRTITDGAAAPNSGVPGALAGETIRRVLRAPAGGTFETGREIGDLVSAGDEIARTAGEPVVSEISGRLRGLIRPGIPVENGWKVGDVDPRTGTDPALVSDKALAVAGGVLEAILRASAAG